MAFTEEARARAGTDWDAAVGHRFVDELWAGTVDDAVMARYLSQDLQFVDAFVALLGAAVAACDRSGPRLVLARQLGLIANDEDDYFIRSLDRLGVGPAARDAPVPATATVRFVELMDSCRRSGDYGSIMTVLAVAEWLYLDWASRPGEPPADPLYRDWIDLHRGEAFAAWTAFLRTETDRAAASATDAGREEMATVFARAVELERAFFDAAYAPT